MQIPADNPFFGRGPVSGASGDLGVRVAQPVALQLRRSARAAVPARWSSATSARISSRRSTTSPPVAAAATMDGANREGAHDNVTSRPPAYHAARRSDSRVRPRASGSRSPAGYVYRGSASGRVVSGPLLLRRLRSGPGVLAGARSSIRERGKLRASNVIEHTAELSNSRRTGQRQLVQRRCRRRALHRRILHRPAAQNRQPHGSAADTDRAQDYSLNPLNLLLPDHPLNLVDAD